MIVYVVYWNEFKNSGVWNKITAQIDAWIKYGEPVELHILTRACDKIQAPKGVKIVRYQFRGWLGRTTAWNLLKKNVLSANPSCIYFRYDVPSIPILSIANKIPLIVEMNTDDRAEYRHPFYKAIINTAGRRMLYKRAAGVVLVSEELRRFLPSTAASKPKIVIGNSVNFDAYPSLPPSTNVKPSFLFVASRKHPWQGVDKVLALASALREYTFHMVGDIDHPAASSNVVFHGSLSHSGIISVARGCDVGIGTLALHRKGGTEACPLKVREYLALGLPVIIAYDDTDFQLSEEFILKVSNSEDGPLKAIDSIRYFGEKWTGKRVPRSCIGHIGTAKKELLRLQFMNAAGSRYRGAGD